MNFTKTQKLIIIAVVIALAVSGVALYQLFIPRSTFFKGAYAVYTGKTTVLFATVTVTLRIEVIDLNATHVKLLMYMKVDSPLGSQERQNTTWVNLKKPQPEEGSKLVKTYEDTVYIEKIGSRNVIVYDYMNKDGSETIFYVDKKTLWPVKITLKSMFSVDLTITETNVPGLL
jgi:hypothetical protein